MRFTGLFLLIMFIFTNSVTSNENGSNKDVHRTVQARYHFNHPPSVEYYNPIPVAVVYENDNGYSGRSDSTATIKTVDENVNIEVSSEENVQATTELEYLITEREHFTTEREETTTITAAFKSIDRSKKVELIPKPRALNDFQIPVAVVYESDPKSSQNNYKTKTDTNTGTQRKRPHYGKNIKTKTNLDEQSTSEIKVENEKSPTSVETGTFKKRTGGREPVVPILESENYVFSHNGMFHYRYESGDGTIAHSEGRSKTIDDETGEAVVGGFSYTDNDGNDFSISYTADENGYRPVGAHLPTPPPIPPAIARALEYLATATPEPVTKRPIKSESLVR